MKTLICVAGMPYAKPTLMLGELIAAVGQPKVTLLTVADDERQAEAAEQLLEQASEAIGLPVEARKVRTGSRVNEMVSEAREGDYDLLVVGASLGRGVLDTLLHSVPRRVTKYSPVSVLIVKDEQPVIRKMVVCTGGQQISRSVVKTGARVAQAVGASVRLFHVADPIPGMYAGLETLDETAAELLQTNTPIAQHLRWGAEVLASHEVMAEVVIARGMAVEEILREAESSDCDLLVLGAQVDSANWINELLISTVTPQVVDRSPCSVLVVR